MNRRDFLKIIVSIPVLGALALFVSPLFRYLRPSSGPLKTTSWDFKGKPTDWHGISGLVKQPDMPKAERSVEFDLSMFPTPWSYQPFTFSQQSKEYTFKHFQASKIPGFVVRLPEDKDGKPDFIVVSRICPHMGCVFNFLPDPAEAAAYNYPSAKNPMFACPCHLSVYDPLQSQEVSGQLLAGKVVSGPAPRPPRHFQYDMQGSKLVITALEAGGIA
ncbi:QcrA and Rieske domain-containing protein [Vampirovibrio chlorellavorus]|uniref:QcrA and Rieske domain-containing protein n=1 Tax=Vampirovibrio chlorellavorus TaxID=758823 RepID=UPI0026EC45AD|nr:ubiquinol-cytochrome c reductase iron-sulfur subunit [Vampirovibrio chlorellavorus]